MNLLKFMDKFGSEEMAIDYFMRVSYPCGIQCPHCLSGGNVQKRNNSKGKLYICKDCRYEFSIFRGTIFEKSSTDFRIWLYAIWQSHILEIDNYVFYGCLNKNVRCFHQRY